MAITPEMNRWRSRLANAAKSGDAEAEAQARRALGLARVERDITEAIAKAPPLDAETRSRIVALIPPAGAVTRPRGELLAHGPAIITTSGELPGQLALSDAASE